MTQKPFIAYAVLDPEWGQPSWCLCPRECPLLKLCTSMLSLMLIGPLIPSSNSQVTLLKISAALEMPKVRHLYLMRPMWVPKVVLYLIQVIVQAGGSLRSSLPWWGWHDIYVWSPCSPGICLPTHVYLAWWFRFRCNHDWGQAKCRAFNRLYHP